MPIAPAGKKAQVKYTVSWVASFLVSARARPGKVLGKKKKNARAHAGRQAKLRLDGSKLGQKKRGSDW